MRERARAYVAGIAAEFPGDAATGVLDEGDEAEARFETLADDEPCPALDPATGLCDLYAARPITCRTFGPPVQWGSGSLGVCELCFVGATDAEIAACEVEIDPEGLEVQLEAEARAATGVKGLTIVAYALVIG